MNKKPLDEKYAYQIEEHNIVHLFCGEDDCQQYLTNPLLSAIFKIETLEKENVELDCQRKRNIYCYSCKNATEVCFKNEIGCPCGKYKSYKDENAELEKELKDACEKVVHLACNQNKDLKNKLTKAKEIIKELIRVEYADFTNGDYSNELSKVLEQAEQFLQEIEK